MAWPVSASSVTPSGRPAPPPVSTRPWLGAANGFFVAFAPATIVDASLSRAHRSLRS